MGIINNYYFTFNEAFKDSYRVNPKKTLWLMKLCMVELGCDVEDSLLMKLKPILFNESRQLLIMHIIMGILGLTALENFLIFLFGFAFFAAGFAVGSSSDSQGGNLIFLFSHGLTGLIIMIGSVIGSSIELYLSNKLYLTLFLLGVISCLFGIFNVVISCLKEEFGRIPFSKSKCFLLFTVGFLIISVVNLLIRFGVI